MGDHRRVICRIISKMLDAPDKVGIYATSNCYDALEEHIEETIAERDAEIERMKHHAVINSTTISNLHAAITERDEEAKDVWQRLQNAEYEAEQSQMKIEAHEKREAALEVNAQSQKAEIERLEYLLGNAKKTIFGLHNMLDTVEKREAALLAFVEADDLVAFMETDHDSATYDFDFNKAVKAKAEAREKLRGVLDDS